MRPLLFALLGIASLGSLYCSPVHAAPDNAGTAYFYHFGQVIGEVRTAAIFGEVCSEFFPAQASANKAAFEAWQAKHRPFLDEMEQQFVIADRYWDKLNATQQAEMANGRKMLDRMRANAFGLKASVKQQLTQATPAQLMQACEGYGSMLDTPAMDFEHRFAEQLVIIRQGLPALPPAESGKKPAASK